MRNLDRQLNNRMVLIKRLSSQNVKEFNNVHLSLNQFKTLYKNSCKIYDLSAEIIDTRAYLARYHDEIQKAQNDEASVEEINQATHHRNEHNEAPDYSSHYNTRLSRPVQRKHVSRISRAQEKVNSNRRNARKHTTSNLRDLNMALRLYTWIISKLKSLYIKVVSLIHKFDTKLTKSN